jgi:hypothetical protein
MIELADLSLGDANGGVEVVGESPRAKPGDRGFSDRLV